MTFDEDQAALAAAWSQLRDSLLAPVERVLDLIHRWLRR